MIIKTNFRMMNRIKELRYCRRRYKKLFK